MSAVPQPIDDAARETAASWCLRIAEGRLSADDHAELEAWLASDTAYPDLFERTVAAWSAIEEQGAGPEMLRMRADAITGVRRANRLRWMDSPRWRTWFALAASVLIVIAVGGVWWQLQPTVYQTAAGERRVIVLADGSRVSLDASSRVDVRYTSGERQLWLKTGRAKFTVAKDPLRPFSVEAGNRLVVATGTQFSVERVSNEVRVILYEGHVSVMETGIGGTKPRALSVGPKRVSAEQLLTPGREMVVSATEPVARVADIDLARSVTWEGGILEFVDEPLGLAVERMNRYGSTRLSVGNATDAQIPISGQFQGGNAAAFVEGVTAVFPLRARANSDGSITLISRSE